MSEKRLGGPMAGKRHEMMRHPQVTGFTVREPFLEVGPQAALLLQALLVPDVRLVNRYVPGARLSLH